MIVKKRDGSNLLICKGAVEEVMGIATEAELGRKTVHLTPELRENGVSAHAREK